MMTISNENNAVEAVLNIPSGPPIQNGTTKITPTDGTTKTTPTESITRIHSSGAHLIPMNLEEAPEREILYNQRVICGWALDQIPFWRKVTSEGLRSFFWIALPSPSSAKSKDDPNLTPITRGAETFWPIGHVAVDKVDLAHHPLVPDESLVAPDGSVLSISSLFILPSFSGTGIGAFAMDECERLARHSPYGSPNCRAVTLTTLSPRYLANGIEGPEGMGLWDVLGQQMPRRDNSTWYLRRGYVGYKEEVRYFDLTHEGKTVELFALFMRKELGARVEGAQGGSVACC